MVEDDSSYNSLELSSCRQTLFDQPTTPYANFQQQYTHPSSAALHHNIHGQHNNRDKQSTHTRRRQRFRRKKAKATQKEITKQVVWEKQQLNIKQSNIVNTTTQRTCRKFGFVPTILPGAIHRNAQHLLGETHPVNYFQPVRKLAFHDLTSNQKLPLASNQLLGLGLKFIPTPRVNITSSDIERSLARFERDIGLRVFFSGDDSSETYEPNALRGTSTWRAPLPPREIDNRIQSFTQDIERIFTPRRIQPNLSNLQQYILKQLKQNKNITILSADKGLGPDGVDTKQYIEWGLKHLLDTTTYSILTKDQAIEECNALYKEIFQWTCTHRQTLGDDTTRYIRERIEKARVDPFGYFYLLAKLHKTPTSTARCAQTVPVSHTRLVNGLTNNYNPLYVDNELTSKILLH